MNMNSKENHLDFCYPDKRKMNFFAKTFLLKINIYCFFFFLNRKNWLENNLFARVFFFAEFHVLKLSVQYVFRAGAYFRFRCIRYAGKRKIGRIKKKKKRLFPFNEIKINILKQICTWKISFTRLFFLRFCLFFVLWIARPDDGRRVGVKMQTTKKINGKCWKNVGRGITYIRLNVGQRKICLVCVNC